MRIFEQFGAKLRIFEQNGIKHICCNYDFYSNKLFNTFIFIS